MNMSKLGISDKVCMKKISTVDILLVKYMKHGNITFLLLDLTYMHSIFRKNINMSEKYHSPFHANL